MATLAPPRPAESPPRPRVPAVRRVRPPSLDALFTAVFAVFGWGVGIERLSDNSFFWHLRTGRLILDQGLPHADPFSFTAEGTHWVGQSWLAEVLYGALDRTVGPFGIRLVGGIVGAAITVLVFRLALRLARERVRASLLSVAALGGLYTLWSERPLLLGVLFLVVLIWAVEVPDCVVGRRPLLALPVIFWLWANAHGTWILGFAYLALHFGGRWLEGHRPWEDRERRLLIGAAISFAALFVNPYGLSLVTFPIELLQRGDVLRDVIEWSSPDFHHVRGMAFALWIVVFTVIVARGPRRVSRRDLLVALPFLLLGFWALRNVALAPLVGLPIVARAVAVRDPQSPREEPRLRIAWLLAGVLAVIAIAIGARAASRPDFALDAYPVRAMDWVDDEGLLGSRLLADDADGGYIILRYWPDQQVFFDDRFDMYPRAVVDDFATVSAGLPGWERVLEARDVEVIVWGRDRTLTQLLDLDDGWDQRYEDDDFVVFVRDDVTPA